jgi:hypothetical protein
VLLLRRFIPFDSARVNRESDDSSGRIATLGTHPLSLNPTLVSRPQHGPVMRSVATLRLHSALADFNWVDVLSELGDAIRSNNLSEARPLLITTAGTILDGFGQWQSAILTGQREISCIEYVFDDAEALQFIIACHRPSRVWNSFNRIRLALKLEPFFQEKAIDNMRSGGKHKGLAKLPEAQRLDVRQEIANAAGVGARNVCSVKNILQIGHPQIIKALQDGLLSINRAVQMCKQIKSQQAILLLKYISERENNKVIRQVITRLKGEKRCPSFAEIMNALAQQEAGQPGSVTVKMSRLRRSVVIVGHDLLSSSLVQGTLSPK